MQGLRAQDPPQVGGYRLVGRLGSGGMGRVYLGRSPGGRLVAVKVIRAELADDGDFRGRFAREVDLARRVSGIYTTPVVDADPDGNPPWLATAYVDGPSLAEHIRAGGPMPADGMIMLARGLAEGLSAIHAAGVVHRDLKPSNVLLAADGPRIIDFGISRAADASAVTRTGSFFGSPGFMSPEQAAGRGFGPAGDMFSLGAVLAYAATGENPFGEGEPPALLYRVVHSPPALDGVPEPLRAQIAWCMDKDPARRPSAGELLARLNDVAPAGSTFLARPGSATAPVPLTKAIPQLRRRRWRWVAAVAVAAAVGAGAVLVIHLEGTAKSGTPGAAALATQHAAAAVKHDAGTPSPAVRASATCPHISYGADGTAGPLFCSGGQPNPPVLAYYRGMHLLVLKLGPDATPAQVLHAMCSDLPESSYPIETDAYSLAQRTEGWSFGVNPAQEMIQACR